MKQVLVKGGKVHIEEIPPPTALPGAALVRVHYSLISSGTESGFVSGGGIASHVVRKAREPLNVEKVKRKIASIGVKGTLDIIRNKLFEFQAPGYSTAGVLVECGRGLQGFREGDRVACAGAGHASHAEYNVIPSQLLTPVPDGVELDEAAFVALGAIAMQGVRRAEPNLGETVVVLGLGLLGQLAVQLLRASGCHVIGCDVIEQKRALARQLGTENVCAPETLADAVMEWTGGHGADAVIVCAASKQSVVTNQAVELCRPKGRVSVVGAVGLHLDREPLYMKEIDFRLSCSYGPGRYQANYEEKGLDYPIGHVRWTEGRNMAEFLRLLDEKQVQVKPLISLVKPVAEAEAAYAAVLEGDPDFISALISYGGNAEALKPAAHKLVLRTVSTPSKSVGVALIGAGSFASAHHLPNLGGIAGCHLEAVVSRTGAKAKQSAAKFNACYCTTDYAEVLADPKVNAVIITTRHNLHKEIALAAAEAGKHILVEKPLALTVEDCEAIVRAVEAKGVLLSVGFNRRFSAFATQMKRALDRVAGPKMVIYRCNAGALPPNHWTMDPEEGGGRILGEAVHFIDFCCWLLGAAPVSVKAEKLALPNGATPGEDNLSAVLRFPDASLATMLYCTTGHPGVSKERIEAFAGGGAVIIEDFRGIQFYGMPGKSVRAGKEDKGQRALLENFLLAVQGKAELGISAADGLRATRIALDMLREAGSAPDGGA